MHSGLIMINFNFDLTHLSLEELLGCMLVAELVGISQIGTKQEAPQWTFKKTYLVAFLGHTDVTETVFFQCQ